MKKIKLYKFKIFNKKSGKLVPVDFSRIFPTSVKRIFYIYGKKNMYRGDHAHRKCSQFFIPISGKIDVITTARRKKESYILNFKKKNALYVPPMIWCRLKFLDKNSIVLVVCDRRYEFEDYIETYKEFLDLEKNRK